MDSDSSGGRIGARWRNVARFATRYLRVTDGRVTCLDIVTRNCNRLILLCSCVFSLSLATAVSADTSKDADKAKSKPSAKQNKSPTGEDRFIELRTVDRPRLTHQPVVESLDPAGAGTKAAGRALTILDGIRSSVKKTWYQHKTKVNRRKGIYGWDCSGMTSWILRRVAPRAHKALYRDRPVAKTFLKAILRAPVGKPKHGWQQIGDMAEVRPGDIFAWRRPKEWGKGVTGHVGFIISRPQPVTELDNTYVVRIMDATRYRHQDDTRVGKDTGFGAGTILFMTDDSGKPIAYAWHGVNSRWAVITEVGIGRVSR